jgi:hypothetical protein
MFTIAARYSINYFWTIFRKRPFTDHYIDHREPVPTPPIVAEQKS